MSPSNQNAFTGPTLASARESLMSPQIMRLEKFTQNSCLKFKN